MLLEVAAVALLSTPATARPALSGSIRSDDGKPVEGALVFIYTARPRSGTSTTCPSCYLDCRKRARTGANGEFSIPSLDPQLLFEVGATAEGYLAAFQRGVDPAAGPLAVSLAQQPPLPKEPKHVLRGRVLDGDGAPVVGALVEPIGYQIGEPGPQMSYRRTFGAFGVDPTITGADGRFAFAIPLDVDALFISVEARDLAPKTFDQVATGGDERVLQLGPGRAIRGRVVRDGQPVAGAVLGVAQVSRNAETFVGERTAETDRDGRFLLLNLPPDEPLVFYGKVDGLGGRGALAEQDIESAAEGHVRDLREIALEPGVMVSGRVVLADGRPVPPHTRILVGRLRAWDHTEVEVSPDGGFRLGPFPRESVEVSIRVRGYELSTENESLLPDSGDARESLAGRLEGDTELRIVLTPVGQLASLVPLRHGADWAALHTKQEAVRARPLRGAAPRP